MPDSGKAVMTDQKSTDNQSGHKDTPTIDDKRQSTPERAVVDNIPEKIHALQQAAIQMRLRVNRDLDVLVSAVTDVDEQLKAKEIALTNTSSKASGKVSKNRESRIHEMLNTPDIRTIYNILSAFFLVSFFSVVVRNSFETGRPFDLALLYNAFGKPLPVISCWLAIFSFSLAGYMMKPLARIQSVGVTVFHVLLQFAFLATVGGVALWIRFPPASALIVLCECTRLSMKIHAFYRECQKSQELQASFKQYLFFLFAPTLIYRDEYPRLATRDWRKIGRFFAEFLGTVLYIYVVFERHCVPQFQNIAQEPNDFRIVTLAVFNTMGTGTMILVFGFFGLLHCWLNAWAEIMRFADRQFYRDWWNSKSFGEYYPKWNGVVHEWLYNYVYLDFLKLLESMDMKPAKAQMFSKIFVIEFSALLHEYIITCTLGFFYPVLWILFGGAGVVFMNMNKARSTHEGHNLFMWMMLIIGNGILTTFICREYYSRQPTLAQDQIFSAEYWHDFFRLYSWKEFVMNIV